MNIMITEHRAGLSVIIFYSTMVFIISWVGNVLLGYNLEVWFGYGQWYEVNFLLRLLIGFISISVAIPFAVIGFLISLVFGIPILL